MYKQPVAQSPIKALAPGDLGLLGSRNPDMGVESILTPFMQQAEICIVVLLGEHAHLPHLRREAPCCIPRLSREGLGGRFLGLMADLDGKPEGDNSMPGK